MDFEKQKFQTKFESVFSHSPNQSINLNISFRPSYITLILSQLFFINQHDIMEEYFTFSHFQQMVVMSIQYIYFFIFSV